MWGKNDSITTENRDIYLIRAILFIKPSVSQILSAVTTVRFLTEARLIHARSPRDKPAALVFLRKKPVCIACS